MDEELPPEELFELPTDGQDEPREIAARLVADLPEFVFLREGEARLLFLIRCEPKVRQGRMILGECWRPVFQGSTKPFCTWMLACMFQGVPDYIITLDKGWWSVATPRQREILVYHELSHCTVALDKEGEPKFRDDGRPVWAIAGHDMEEFNAVVKRYGAWAPDIRSFIDALRQGGAI